MLKQFLNDERGSFIENGLWIIVVVLLVAGASLAFAGNLKDKFDGISEKVDGVEIPDIQ